MPAITRSRSRLGLFAIELGVAMVVGVVLFLASTSPTHAQATRTWVSAGVGNDINPCSRTAPCQTFAGAISKTAVGGEIDALDPGGYGAVTITKSITIDGTGTFASILASGVNGINVNGNGTDIVVVIRGLSINGAGTTLGVHGINISQAASVHVENTVIENFSNTGINFHSSTNGAQLFVTNTDIRNVGSSGGTTNAGIFADSTTSATVSVDRSTFDRANVGLSAQNNVKMIVSDSVVTNNSTAGVLARPTTGTAEVTLERVVVSYNGGSIQAGGGGGPATIRLSNSTVVDNTVTMTALAGGTFRSFVNNQIDFNGTNVLPTIINVALH